MLAHSRLAGVLSLEKLCGLARKPRAILWALTCPYHYVMIEPTENSDGTVRNLRPWKPGQSSNPSGADPRALRKPYARRAGGDPTKLIEGLLAIARGEGQGVNSKAVRHADQIRAYELLLAYGWGKPAAFVPIEGADLSNTVAAEIRSIARR